MNKATKRALQIVLAGGCTALVVGCGTLSPDVAPSAAQAADDPTLTVSRARVVAELKEAQRLGLITVGEESPRVMTAEEIRRVAQAGEDAAVAEVGTAKAK